MQSSFVRRNHIIAFEGVDGAGKTFMAAMAADYLKTKTSTDVLSLSPATSTKVGQRLVETIKAGSLQGACAYTEAAVFVAAHVELINKKLIPYAEEPNIIVLDRFYLSTFAYQIAPTMFQIGADSTYVQRLLNTPVHNSPVLTLKEFEPNLTIVLDLPYSTAIQRVKRLRPDADAIESRSEEYFEKVRNGFTMLATGLNTCPEPAYVIVDATRPIEDVWIDVKHHLDGELATLKSKNY